MREAMEEMELAHFFEEAIPLKFLNAPFGRDLAQMGRERSHGSWCTWYRPHFDTCA